MESNYGLGTVYQRKSDGRWIAAFEIPRTKAEPRRRRVGTSKTEEGARAKLEQFRSEHPPKQRHPSRMYLSRKAYMEAARKIGTHTEREWFALGNSVGWLCTYCGKAPGLFRTNKDHIIPVSRGGSDGIDNIAVSCRDCNYDKGPMTGDEYRLYRQGLA